MSRSLVLLPFAVAALSLGPPDGRLSGQAPAARGPRTDAFGDPLPPGAVARLGTVHLSHGDAETALSPDGKTLAVATHGGQEPTLALWDTATGRQRLLLAKGRTQYGRPVFTPDGKRLAVTAGWQIRFWDVATGKRLRPTVRPRRYVLDFVFSPDGALVAISTCKGYTCKVCVWDLRSGKRIRNIPIPGTHLEAVAFCADGKRLVTSSRDSRAEKRDEAQAWTVCLWEARTGRKLLARRPEEQARLLSPDGRLFGDIGRDRATVRLREVITGREKPAVPWSIGPFAVTRDGKTLATSSESGHLCRVWDVATGRLRKQIGDSFVTSFHVHSFSADGRWLAAQESNYGNYARTRLWDTDTGKEVGPAAVHHGTVTCLAWSPDGRTLATGSEDRTVRLWEADTGRQRRVLAKPGGAIWAVAFSRDGKALASADADGAVQISDTVSGRSFQLPRKLLSADWLAFSTDGQTLRGGDRTGVVMLWDLAARKHGASQPAPWLAAGRTIPHPDGRTSIALGVEPKGSLPNEMIRLWDTKAGKEGIRLRTSSGVPPVNRWLGVALSRDGRLLATSEYVAEEEPEIKLHIRLWETTTGREIRCWDCHKAGRCLAFSSDGMTLASSHDNSSAYLPETRVWDAATGKELACFKDQASWVSALAFSPDGRRLAVGSWDTTVLVYDVANLCRPRQPASLSAAELAAHWQSLAEDDAGRAWQAINALATVPTHALPFLSERLRPEPAVDSAQLRRWVADLNHRQFAVRQRAAEGLSKAGEQAEAVLLRALKEKRSLEQRRRVQAILDRLSQSPPRAETLRALRALAVLERIASPEARRLLQSLAQGAAMDRLTREARLALDRLAGRRAAVP